MCESILEGRAIPSTFSCTMTCWLAKWWLHQRHHKGKLQGPESSSQSHKEEYIWLEETAFVPFMCWSLNLSTTCHFYGFSEEKKVKRIALLRVSKRILAAKRSVLSEKGLTIRELRASLRASVSLHWLILWLVFCLPPSLLASFHHQFLLFLSFYLFLLTKFIIMNHTMLFQMR